FALFPRRKNNCPTALGTADAIGGDIAGEELHDVVHRESIIHHATRTIDIEVDVRVFLHALQTEHLHDDSAGADVMNLTDEENHAVFQQHFFEGHLAIAVIAPLRPGHGHRHHHRPAPGNQRGHVRAHR